LVVVIGQLVTLLTASTDLPTYENVAKLMSSVVDVQHTLRSLDTSASEEMKGAKGSLESAVEPLNKLISSIGEDPLKELTTWLEDQWLATSPSLDLEGTGQRDHFADKLLISGFVLSLQILFNSKAVVSYNMLILLWFC
jgi:hypothetical protein